MAKRVLTLQKGYYTKDGKKIKGFFTVAGKHIPIVEESDVQQDAKYVRFGEIPEDEESANFTKLSRDQLEDVSFYMRTEGLTPRQAMEKAGVNPEGKFEHGVSSFFLDEEGLPKIETASQLKTFWGHAHGIGTKLDLNEKMFSYNGGQSGTGADREPIVRDLKGSKEYKLSGDDVLKVYEKTLNEHYGKKTPMTEEELAEYKPSKNTYNGKTIAFKHGWNDLSVVFFDGYKYEEPDESFGATILSHRRKSFKTLKY